MHNPMIETFSEGPLRRWRPRVAPELLEDPSLVERADRLPFTAEHAVMAGVIQEGDVTFTVGDDTIEATGGRIVTVPVGVPHKFLNAGPQWAWHIDYRMARRVGGRRCVVPSAREGRSRKRWSFGTDEGVRIDSHVRWFACEGSP